LVSLVNAAYSLDRKDNEFGPAVMQRYQAVQKGVKMVDKHVAEPELSRLLKTTRSFILMVSSRVSEGTKTKAKLLIDSISAVGDNWKDLSNLGALVLNAAIEASLHSWKPKKARSAMLLSLKISERSLFLSPDNDITMSNIVAATKTLQQQYNMSAAAIRQKLVSKTATKRNRIWWSMFVDFEKIPVHQLERIKLFAKAAPFVQVFSAEYEVDHKCKTIATYYQLGEFDTQNDAAKLQWCNVLRFLRTCRTKGTGIVEKSRIQACVLIGDSVAPSKKDLKNIVEDLEKMKSQKGPMMKKRI